MRILHCLVLMCFLGALKAHAEYPKPPLEAYGALPQIGDAEISPDGTKMAAIANIDGETYAVVFQLGAGIVARVLVDRAKARSVEFFDNDHVILRVSEHRGSRGATTVRRRGGEYRAALSFNIETGEIRRLLSETKKGSPFQSGWGRIIGRGSDEGSVLMPASMGRSQPSLDLLVTDLSSTYGTRIIKGTGDTIDWFVGSGGSILARERYSRRDDLYRIQAFSENKWKTIYREKSDILPRSVLGVAPDESGLILLGVLNEDYDQLLKIDLDGEITPILIPPEDREIERIITDDNRKVIGVRYSGLTPTYDFLDGSLESSYTAVSTQLPKASLYLDSWTDDRDLVLYRVFDRYVGESWLIHQQSTNSLQLVAKRRPNIPAEALSRLSQISYVARDGLEITGVLSLPPGDQTDHREPLPAIILPHGGPELYDKFDFDWMAQYFANRGYAVFQPNFRGSAGFGFAFKEAGHGEWGGKMQDDITDGVRALVDAGTIDENRVCIAGASYGGYAALIGATFTPELYSCVIAIAPVTDLNLMLLETKVRYGYSHWVLDYWKDLMVDGEARRNKLKAISPINFASSAQAPILILHGDTDTVVPYTQSLKMVKALQRAGKDVSLIKLEGEDHWLSVAETRLQTLQAMDTFISEHLPIDE